MFSLWKMLMRQSTSRCRWPYTPLLTWMREIRCWPLIAKSSPSGATSSWPGTPRSTTISPTPGCPGTESGPQTLSYTIGNFTCLTFKAVINKTIPFSAGDGEQGREMRTLIQVDYQGNVTLLTQGIYMTKCQIDVSHYPFNPQRCSLKFASWTTEITRLNLSIGQSETLLGIDILHPIWDLSVNYIGQ